MTYKLWIFCLTVSGFVLTVCGILALLPSIVLPEILLTYVILYWVVGVALFMYDSMVLLISCTKPEHEAMRWEEEKLLLTERILKSLFYSFFLASVVVMAIVINIAEAAKERRLE